MCVCAQCTASCILLLSLLNTQRSMYSLEFSRKKFGNGFHSSNTVVDWCICLLFRILKYQMYIIYMNKFSKRPSSVTIICTWHTYTLSKNYYIQNIVRACMHACVRLCGRLLKFRLHIMVIAPHALSYFVCRLPTMYVCRLVFTHTNYSMELHPSFKVCICIE